MTSEEKTYLAMLIDTYSAKVYSFCEKICINKNDAEDLYQDVFLILAKNVHKIQKEQNVLSYIYKICVLQYKNAKRKYARRARIAPLVYSDSDTSPEVAASDDIAKDYEKKELLNAVSQTVKKLEDKYKIPIILYYGREAQLSEISKILSIPTGTVKSRLFTARKIIAKELITKGYDINEY